MMRPPRPLRPLSFPAGGQAEYRVEVFGEPRGLWRDSYAEAKWDAIDADLASYDEELGEYYLAVPVEIRRRRRTQALAA